VVLRAGLVTGLLSWSSLPGYLSYLGRHFAAFLAAEGIDTPVLVGDPDAELRGLAMRFLGYLRQRRTRPGRPALGERPPPGDRPQLGVLGDPAIQVHRGLRVGVPEPS
jgi:hypothetical protein